MKTFQFKIRYIFTSVLVSSLIVWIFLSYIHPYYDNLLLTNSIQKEYNEHVKALVPAAILQLQKSNNDWTICTEMGLELNNESDPHSMAAWIAYYKVGSQYCKRWWKWPPSKCEFLKSQRQSLKGVDLHILEKRIILCEISQKNL